MPETTEGANFNENGECMACQAQKIKYEVDWKAKRKELDKILTKAKEEAGNNYDCIVPISGGKDSIYQLHVICKEYGMKPLAVTFNHGGFTKTGFYNLQNCLKQFNIDHFQFSLNDEVIKKIQKRSIETIGDYCWHCHSMVASITLQTAVNYGINLIVWGESGAEYGHQGATYNNIVKFDKDYFTKLSSKFSSEEFCNEELTMRDLYPASLPSEEQCKNLVGIHLGNYMPWNAEGQVKFVKETYGWKEREVSGSYKKYKSIECSFEPIHEFLCYLKRGYARTTLQASQEIREGVLNKEQAMYLINKYERIEPKHLNYFLERVGLTGIEFRNIIEKLKHEKIKGINLPADKEWRKVEEDGEPCVDRFIKEMKGE
jgi:N-acetyl sugar amidotransferase